MKVSILYYYTSILARNKCPITHIKKEFPPTIKRKKKSPSSLELVYQLLFHYYMKT